MTVRGVAVATLAFAGLATPSSAQLLDPARREALADALRQRRGEIEARLQTRGAGILGLMGYNMTPDGSANSMQINRSSAGRGSSVLSLSQFGFGFTVSESFPLFLEGYIGYARYDPSAVFTGLEDRRVSLRWNNLSMTTGIGYDIRIGEYLWLRPILNLSLGYAASDVSLFGSFVNFRTDADLDFLTRQHVNVTGIGGSLMLAYYDYQPARDIDVELRYTQIQLRTFGDTMPSARGSATAQTAGVWARYRWPTGLEAFGRPMRWVIDGSASTYLGDQREVMDFTWSAKIGGGIEFETGRYEIGAAGINLNRVRLIARYFFGDRNVSGISVGLGMSF